MNLKPSPSSTRRASRCAIFGLTDGEAYLRINCDPAVQQFMGQPKLPSTPEDVQRWIANMNGHYYQKAKATICTEAVAAVLDFAFHRLRLHRIQATVHPENVASPKVLKKHGFREEALLRQGNFGNEFRDHFLLALLCDDLVEKDSNR